MRVLPPTLASVRGRAVTVAAALVAAATAGCAKHDTSSPIWSDDVAAPDDAADPDADGELSEAAMTTEPTSVAIAPGPAAGWLEAHGPSASARERLGGPVEVKLSQHAGGVYVILPDKGPLSAESPYGDKFVTMYNGKLEATLVDATAADSGSSADTATLSASWEDMSGNVYEVRCCSRLETTGTERPTFGGVVTNHALNGFTGMGDGSLPSTFAYAAFWGVGEVLENGEVREEGVPVQLLLTERIRDDRLHLVGDEGVDPGDTQLHLLVSPARYVDGQRVVAPIDTGYPFRGGTMPFWHVVFPAHRIAAAPGS